VDIKYYKVTTYYCPRCGARVDITKNPHSRMAQCTKCKWKGYHPLAKNPSRVKSKPRRV